MARHNRNITKPGKIVDLQDTTDEVASSETDTEPTSEAGTETTISESSTIGLATTENENPPTTEPAVEAEHPSTETPSEEHLATPVETPAPEPTVGTAGAAGLTVDIGDYICMKRAPFEKMMVALSTGHNDNYVGQSLPRQIMDLFGIATRELAVVKLRELMQSHRDRTTPKE